MQMTVRDRRTDEQQVILITQAGLKFTDRLLRSRHIERAAALLDHHLERSAAPARPGALPLMVSAGGTGRSLLLRGYHAIQFVSPSKTGDDEHVSKRSIIGQLKKRRAEAGEKLLIGGR